MADATSVGPLGCVTPAAMGTVGLEFCPPRRARGALLAPSSDGQVVVVEARALESALLVLGPSRAGGCHSLDAVWRSLRGCSDELAKEMCSAQSVDALGRVAVHGVR